MAKPKVRPMSMMGRKDSNGCGSSMSPNMPSWKMATVTPNVAAMDRPKPSAAISGTQIERNTSISTMNASPRTMAM